MKQKIIAALVLGTLSCSSIVLGAGLPLPSHFAMKMESTRQSATAGREHACCPHPHVRALEMAFQALMSPAMPCGNEHPCCARSAPEAPPSLPAESNVTIGRADIVANAATGLLMGAASEHLLRPMFEVVSPPSYVERSTVLRI